MGNTGSKGGSSGSGGSGNKGNSNNDKNSREIGMWGVGESKTVYSNNGGGNIFTNTGKPYYESYPSNTSSKSGDRSISGGGDSGSQSSGGGNHNGSGYSLTAIQNLPRIATDTEFAATGHGNIAVESIVHHAIQQNSTGKGINAISSLQMINLSYNKLNDNDLCNLNTGLIGYTLNLKVFNLSYNNFSDAGIDYLIKGLAGVQYLQAGGRELSGVMQGLFTHYNVNITTINLSNNHIGDIGVDIISNAIVTNSLPHVKALNLADNNITDTGAGYLAEGLKSKGNKLKVLHLEGNNITKTGEGYLVKTLLDKAVQHMVIFTQKLEQNSKLLPGIGTKEEKIAMYREYLKQGIEKGTNDQAIVVDKSFWGKVEHTKNQVFASGYGIAGFIKCNWQPDDVIESYAQENLVAKISKTLSKIFDKLNVVNGVTSCYLQATDEMYTSVPGQKVVTHKLSELEGNHELQVIGESEFSGD